MRIRRTLFLPLAAALFLALPTLAQNAGGVWERIHDFSGGVAESYGCSLAILDDLDGDGNADFAVGSRRSSPGGLAQAGTVFVYSGATGAILFRFDGDVIYAGLGESVAAAGDVDGDGIGDIVAGAPYRAVAGGYSEAGSALVYSGASGALLHRFDGTEDWGRLGFSVAGPGDVDGDGFADLLVGTDSYDLGGLWNVGAALVYSGATGTLLYRLEGDELEESYGQYVGAAGDVDADGVPDFLIGIPYENFSSLNGSGGAAVVSGATGLEIFHWSGTGFAEGMGRSVAGAGDVDQDGHSDLLVGAPNADPLGRHNAGTVDLYSGFDGSLLQQAVGETDDSLGIWVSGAGDVDGDGTLDFIAGAPFASPGGVFRAGYAVVVSGATQLQIVKLFGDVVADSRLGSAVAGGRDLDADGFDDVLIGAPGYRHTTTDPGAAQVWSLRPCLTTDRETLSGASGGTVFFDLDFPISEKRQEYVLLGSATGTGPIYLPGKLRIPLTRDWFFKLMASGIQPVFFSNGMGKLDRFARATGRLDVPVGGALAFIGQTFWFAAVTYDPPQLVRASSVARALLITY